LYDLTDNPFSIVVCAGLAYMQGVEILKDVRGGDLSSNHFILGFSLSAPFTLHSK